MNLTIASSHLPVSAGAQRQWQFAAAFVLLLAIALAPIMVVTVPMLSDYPNHLARMHILQAGGMSAELNAFYSVDWRLMPNLAMDVIVPPLARIVGIYEAGKIFLALTLLLLASGTVALHAALHRRLSPWPLAVMLLLHSQIFLYGVVNFLFGLGIALWALAAWVGALARPRVWHAPAFALIATLVWISHLSAFGVLALAMCATSYDSRLPVRAHSARLGLLAASLAPPISLTLSATSTTALANPEAAQHSATLAYYFIVKPMKMLTTFNAFHPKAELAFGIVVFLLLIIGFKRKIITIHPTMKWAVGAMVIAFLVTPRFLMGSALADYRILLAAQFLFVASVDFRAVALTLPRRILALGLLAVFATRSLAITQQWERSDHQARIALAAFDLIDPGSRLFPAVRMERGGETFQGNYDGFLPCLAVISRATFVPSLYSTRGAQPVAMTPAYEQLRSATPQPRLPAGEEPDWIHVTANYDYLWVPTRERFTTLPLHKLRLVASHPGFRLYEVTTK